MDSPRPVPPAPLAPAPGLPPVTPPSGRFIAQLFLVPGMIVLVAVVMLLAFRYLLGGGYVPANFLKQLDSDNADVRWRGASDLAQVLKRPESMHLRSDPALRPGFGAAAAGRPRRSDSRRNADRGQGRQRVGVRQGSGLGQASRRQTQLR